VKEALFSILGPVSDADVLDLFAGTGALGIEALSRGARSCTFVEVQRPALVALRQNLVNCALQAESQVLPLRVERTLTTAPWGASAFDLILIDPPYADTRGGRFSPSLAVPIATGLSPALRPTGRVVLEHAASELAPAIPPLALASTRKYGDTALSFYVY